jgi:hypothetical protein
MDTEGSFPGGKATGEREADHPPSYNDEVKNDEAIPPLPHMPS